MGNALVVDGDYGNLRISRYGTPKLKKEVADFQMSVFERTKRGDMTKGEKKEDPNGNYQ
jgi:hypothetical protein